MCDTMVALGNATQDGSVIFAKNSDRQPNEPLLMIRAPRRQHAPGTKVKCTYIEIDQVEETYAVMLLKPSWMWGAEMGANEFGLNIGNEAVFTREKQGPAALLGMDMLRLALERCRSSDEALDLLIDLLAVHGQGGNCGFEKKFFYHNSFLIADPQSAWVFESAGEYWAAEKVKDVRTISNRISIGISFDRSHPDLIKHAVDKGWCKSEADFDFARCYSDPLITRFSGSLNRGDSSSCVLKDESGKITPQTMRGILRSHEAGLEGRQFSHHSLKSVCMHGGFIFGDHTTGSYVAHLKGSDHTYLVSGGSTPCLALFKPFWMIEGEKLSFHEGDEQAALEAWLKRERLHRAVIENRLADLPAYLAERDRIEAEIDKRLAALKGNLENKKLLGEIMAYALNEEEKLLEKSFAKIEQDQLPARIGGNPYFRYYWKKQNSKLFSG
ncbi:MAG: peptidase U34 [Dethiobacteria bacterium]|nr:peptidase U34 [Dethiobacteria bacterium]